MNYEPEQNYGTSSSGLGIARLIGSIVRAYLLACFPAIIFRNLLINEKRGRPKSNSIYLGAIIMGFLFFTSQVFLLSNMVGSNEALAYSANLAAYFNYGKIIYIIYTVFNAINLLTLLLLKPLANIFKSEVAINVAFAILSVAFVVVLGIYIYLLLNELNTMM